MSLPTARTRERVHRSPPATVDVAIIGAGLGGLIAGATLARQGVSVAVFDAHYVAGGCVTQFARGPSNARYQFDIGLHYIGDCGPSGAIPRMLRSVGVELEYLPLDPDGFDTLVFPDFQFRIPADRDLYRERLLAQFPSEKKGIDRYLRLLREIEVLAAQMGKSQWALVWNALLHGRLAASWKGESIGAFLDTCTKDPRLKAVIVGQSGDYGLSPSRCSAPLHAGLVNHYFKGAYYPRGGGQIVSDRIAEALEAAGGTLHLRHPVRAIRVDSAGRACGLRVEGPHGESIEVQAQIVISNADIKQTFLELLPQAALPSDVAARARGWEMGGAIFLTCLGVAGDLTTMGMGRTNYWAFDGYDMEEFYRVNEGEVRVRGCYITSASLKEPDNPEHAPPGHHNLEVMTLVPGRAEAWGVSAEDARKPNYRGTAAYKEKKAAVEEELIQRADALFPGLASKVVFRESATPVTHTRFTWATDGTGYGLAGTPGQFLGHRPGVRGPVPNLYLCGGSTRSGHGVAGALRSGLNAAGAILRDRKS